MKHRESLPVLAPSDEEIARGILAHLAGHPQAMDSPEGIAEWWLPADRPHVSVAQVTCVLQRLVEQGVIEVIGAGVRQCYRRRALASLESSER
jgi:hypothetical protein